MAENEVITTRTGRTWLGRDGIVRGVALPGAYLTLADARENVAAGVKAGGDVQRPALMDLRQLSGIDREAPILPMWTALRGQARWLC